MITIRTAIADDEPLARAALRDGLERVAGFTLVGEAEDGLATLRLIETQRPQLLLLDVQMPELDGFEVLAQIDPHERPAVVFITAFDRHALQAFDAHAVDYLLKPFDRERFSRALARARARLESPAGNEAGNSMLSDVLAGGACRRYCVKRAGRELLVDAHRIEWVSARGNYVLLHHDGGEDLLRRSLSDLHRELDPRRFVRIHRSTIVRLDAILHLHRVPGGDYDVQLRSGATVTLSRTHVEHFRRASRVAP